MGRKTGRHFRQAVVWFALVTLGSASGPLTSATRASELGAGPVADCLTQKLRLFFADGEPGLLTSFEAAIARPLTGLSASQVERELELIVESFARKNPEFPREDFVAWLREKPLNPEDLKNAETFGANFGNILDFRYQVFRIEKNARARVKELGQDLRNVARDCGQNETCRQRGFTAWFREKFPCIANKKGGLTNLMSTYAVQNVSYAVVAASPEQDFAWDLVATNLLWNPILVEGACLRGAHKNPDGTFDFEAPGLTVSQEYRNYFFGQAGPSGKRAGLLRQAASMEWFYIKTAIPYAATYSVFHAATGTLIHGKKLTMRPLSEIPEKERDRYVSLAPGSLLMNSAQNLLYYDLPFAIPRNVFFTDHLYSIALPRLIKSAGLVFVVQTAAKVATISYSTLVFRCWEKDKKNILGCIRLEAGKHPELGIKAVAMPEPETKKD